MIDKVIKTQEEYGAALAELEPLIDIDPELDASDADRLEVLSRKRSLSLPMLRALGSGLDIPIEILAREPEPPPPGEGNIEWVQGSEPRFHARVGKAQSRG